MKYVDIHFHFLFNIISFCLRSEDQVFKTSSKMKLSVTQITSQRNKQNTALFLLFIFHLSKLRIYIIWICIQTILLLSSLRPPGM